MKRRHADSRYYQCTDENCSGEMVQWGNDLGWKKQAVYECTVCHRKAGEASLLTAYNLLRMRD